MQKKTIVILTPAEGKEALVQYYADFLLRDRRNFADMLRTGSLKDLPEFSGMDGEEVATMVRSLPVGNSIATEANVDFVLVQTEGGALLKVGENTVPTAAPVEPAVQSPAVQSMGISF